MEVGSKHEPGAMHATGSGIIQVAGDYSVTQILYQQAAGNSDTAENDPPATRLTPEERTQLAIWTDEVVQAESGLVSARIVRSALNSYLGVKGVDYMTPDMFGRASIFLQGWKSCAAGRELSSDASIAQILRMWVIVPGLRGTVTEFTRATFQREMLKGMSPWELRTTLSYCMTRWQAYWEQRNA
ncbi:hypothetical protein EM868_00355 [Cupriavidus gilardii]|uniref:hypothetical protein n=1 Tax=Cupriavidus gilardii TaxID=82541 RepID=UPI001EE62F5E|nr:hypothetical protein [Cupriavidus gilardii]MCG5260404.1 hypothetical protein [Cupriavidus gilardii]MDF9428254.1 hypothetical protein [Cupriavidus gilardii]